ncbi:MAG: four helix bundle protein [Bacteroidetes bacterium]|nr:four helix bundle protein [Bacteroidota bacterium]
MPYPNDNVDIHERAFEFASNIVLFCDKLNQTPGVNWALANQLVRAGTSIGANIEEAQAGQSKADFIAKLAIALKESRESNYWLRLIARTRPALTEASEPLIQESSALMRILAAILKSARDGEKGR